MQQLEQEIKQWADGKWPARTLASRLRKLGEEVGELAEAVCYVPEHDLPAYLGEAAAREAADCAIVLSDICSLLGYSLSEVMREKFAEVVARPGAAAVPVRVAGELMGCPKCDGVIVLGGCECGFVDASAQQFYGTGTKNKGRLCAKVNCCHAFPAHLPACPRCGSKDSLPL